MLSRAGARLARAARGAAGPRRRYGAGGGDSGDVINKPGGFFSEGLKESGGVLYNETHVAGVNRKAESWEVSARGPLPLALSLPPLRAGRGAVRARAAGASRTHLGFAPRRVRHARARVRVCARTHPRVCVCVRARIPFLLSHPRAR